MTYLVGVVVVDADGAVVWRELADRIECAFTVLVRCCPELVADEEAEVWRRDRLDDDRVQQTAVDEEEQSEQRDHTHQQQHRVQRVHV